MGEVSWEADCNGEIYKSGRDSEKRGRGEAVREKLRAKACRH